MALYNPYSSSSYNLSNILEGITLSKDFYNTAGPSSSSLRPPPPIQKSAPYQPYQIPREIVNPPFIPSTLLPQQQIQSQVYPPPSHFGQLTSSIPIQNPQELGQRSSFVIPPRDAIIQDIDITKPQAYSMNSVIANSQSLNYVPYQSRVEPFQIQRDIPYGTIRSQPFPPPLNTEPLPPQVRTPYPIIRNDAHLSPSQDIPRSQIINSTQRSEAFWNQREGPYPNFRSEVQTDIRNDSFKNSRNHIPSLIKDPTFGDQRNPLISSIRPFDYIQNSQNINQSMISRNFDSRIYEKESALKQSFGPSQIDVNQSQATPINIGQSQIKGSSIVIHPPKGEKAQVQESSNRDQQYYFDSFITLAGYGTYKKFSLKARKGPQQMMGFDQQDSGAKPNTQEEQQKTLWQSVTQTANQSQINQPSLLLGQTLKNQFGGELNQGQFMATLVEIGEVEAEIETIKNDLLAQPDYNLHILFALFDTKQTDKLALGDFITSQQDLPSPLTKQQASFLFSRILPSPSHFMRQQKAIKMTQQQLFI